MIYLYGAGGHAKVIIEIAEVSSKQIIGLIDQNPSIKSLLGYEVSQTVPVLREHEFLVISVGNNEIRKKIDAQVSDRFETLIHPSANISTRVSIKEGSVVMAGVSVNSETKIGRHAILNTNCSIDHECEIGDFVHISPNAALGGNVSVGEGTHIGLGASVIQGITIGKWCTIGAGSVIIKDIADYTTVVGNPGKIIKSKNT